jgi:mono/diheme cytochrome c family protein
VPVSLSVVLSGTAVPALDAATSSAAGSPRVQDAAPSGGSSVVDGVYTLAQVARGAETFEKICTACHQVRDHAGRTFGSKWAGSTVGDLFELVSNTMPEGDPGSLRPDEYAGILALFLKESGYPDGQRELPTDLKALKKIRIEPLDK